VRRHVAELAIRGLRKSYGARTVLKGVDVTVADGEFFCLLGPSGAGKTTLLRCVAGLERPDEGDICIGGRRANDLLPGQRNVAMVFGTYALYPHLTVFENLAYPLRERRIAEPDIRERVERVAATLGVAHTLGRPPQTLSGGEMQRVAIGRAIIREAQVYLFDEPLAHLDAQLRHQMRAELKRLHRELGSTLVYATPDQLEAMTMPQRIAVVRAGEILQTGSPDDLYSRPEHAFVATYVGDPPMNLFPAEVTPGGTVKTPWFDAQFPGVVGRSGRYLLGVRPEDIQVGSVSSGAQGTVCFRADVYAVESFGDYAVVTLATGEHRAKAVVAETAAVGGRKATVAQVDTGRVYWIDPDAECVLHCVAGAHGLGDSR
jgi:multiple sugar transport system ATP-binding protein